MTQAQVSSDEGTKVNAKIAFRYVLDEEELEVQMLGGEMYVGNRLGLELADRKQRFDIFESEFAALKKKVICQDDKIASLNDRLSTLSLALREYRQVRERFISTFKRDKLGNMTEADRKIIQEGNMTVHGGDAAVDALLYEGLSGRNDSKTFIKLYGMAPSDVQKIRHQETLDILSIHAGVLANTSKTGTDEFYAKFQEFIDRFEDSGHDVNYLNVLPATAVTSAYWELLKCQRYKDIA